ncbi:MAG: serine hydrolase [Candidatus Aminicenantes bacterium]|nr:serine hydrolase [Candidatus Aminicenantes bacterium]NIM79082.1 serine hydrolase [Candidatus Aminicenantes bacterium]NIN18361.1 serine hydrolase [Candidatus Aminicenantes bacterium]NIN42248.1 serine hydrolase [Candidatus Aminicenantes bacterium]NIN85014.1 serine hydrolase [Candidatus Aminicenantes bacterium]
MNKFKHKRKPLNVLIILAFVFALFNAPLTGTAKPEMQKLENGLLPPVLIKGEPVWRLTERMKHHKVPGVSIAVIKDFKLHWTNGYGIKDVTTMEPVTEATLFQAASISKPVTAMAVLRKVQEGKLKLDEKVNDVLVTWKLPENQLTKQTPLTIKHLLTHSGGVTVHGFRGYTSSEPIPSLVQVLDGKRPANSEAIRVDMVPGYMFRYSGGGYCILQQLLMDTVKQPFPIIMEDTVLKPLGMTHSTYLQPLPEDRQKFAASGHRPVGFRIKGKWHIYPEMAAAGLWTTSRDLAQFVIELQLSLKNKSNKVLSQETSQQMLTPHVSNFMGLGLLISKPGKNAVYFRFSGDNEGYSCYLIAHKNNGYGAVVMTNSDNGVFLYNEIVRGIANIYQWDDYLPEPHEIIKIAPEKLKPLAGKYAVDSDHVLTLTWEDNRLTAQVTYGEKAKIFPISETKFVRKDERVIYEFVSDAKTGKVLNITAHRHGQKRTYEPKGDDYTVPLELLLAHQVEKALEGYRQLKAKNPYDQNVQALRLLFLAEELIKKGYLKEAIGLIHLTAEFHPEFIKKMYSTLNNEIRIILRNPMIPESFKKELKDGYNSMLKKLGLKEIE